MVTLIVMTMAVLKIKLALQDLDVALQIFLSRVSYLSKLITQKKYKTIQQ